MNYIILDFEWNNAYNYAAKKFVNEIIEIGAIKLDRNLNIIDTFKQLVKPDNFKKLSSRCKNLTNITNTEIKENGISFKKAISDFARWSDGDNSVFMSWSNSDLYVLTINYLYAYGNMHIDFIKKYCDVQKYCMSFLDNPGGNQVSLSHCAEMMEINVDTESLHRALEDCYITSECFKKVFDEEKLKGYITICDSCFFERLMFKPYYISDYKNEYFDLDEVVIKCPKCSHPMKKAERFTYNNNTFKGPVICSECNKTYWAFVRAKKTYDKVLIKVSTTEMNKKRAKKFKKLPKQRPTV